MNTRVEPLRAGLAVVTAVALVAAMMVLFGSAPALGQEGNPPNVECADPLWNGDYWKVQVNDGTAEVNSPETNVNEDAILFDSTDVSDGSVTWTNNHEDEDAVLRVVRKEGKDEGDEVINYDPPVPFGESRTIALDPDISHITFCFTEPPTTTVPEETTTVPEETTTVPEETTTVPEETTTTTIEDEVLGTTITTSTTAPVVEVTTTIVDEVLDTSVEAEELPFTGIDSELLVGMAVLMLMSGLLVLGVTGKREDA